jgi:hypothetical protein
MSFKFNLLVLFIVLSLFSNNSYSQIFDIYSYSNLNKDFDNNKHEVGANVNYFVGSNSINNNLSYALLKNQFIDDDLKKSSLLKANNNFGNHLQTNIYYATMPDTVLGVPDLGMRFGINYYSMQNINFSEDLYDLIFYGNKGYENKNADFSNLDVNRINYQSFEFGFFKKLLEKENGYNTVYLGLSLIKGQDYLYLYTNESSLFTATDGEYIDLSISSSYFTSDSSKSNIGTIGGLGASLNFYWAYEDVKHNSRFEISFTDLGLISWYDNPLNYSADTSIRFNGQEIDDVFNPDAANEITQDSILQTIYSHSDNKTFNKSLPARFQFAYTKRFFNDKYIPTIGMGYFFNSNQNILAFFLNNKYVMSPKFSLDFLLSYGGYTNLGVGLGLSFELIDNLKFKIYSPNVIGAIMPEKSYSNGGFVSMSYAF